MLSPVFNIVTVYIKYTNTEKGKFIMIKRFVSYYRNHKVMFFLDMSASLLLAVCDLFFPMITRSIINDYIPDRNIRMMIIWAAALVLIYLAKAGLNYFIQYYGHVIGVKMQAQMRSDVFTHLQKLPFSYFDDNKTGVIMSRIINDLMDISELAHHGPEDLFLSVIMFIGSFVLLAPINIYLTLIIFASMPPLIIYAMRKRMKLAEAWTRTRKETGEVNAYLENGISGIRVSKSYVNGDYELGRFRDCNGKFVVSRNIAYKVMAEFHSVTTFITDVLYVVVLIAGGLFTYFEMISFGDFTAFILFIGVFLNPIRRLISFIEQYQNGMSGFRRFCEIMDSPEEEEPENGIELEKVKGDIEFDDVTFTYITRDEKSDEKDENGEPLPPKIIKNTVLHDVSFKVQAGKTIALVGPSGGGKTTLCHLIPRFYEVDKGKISVDGYDICSLTRDSLRSAIGLVQQDVFLFTGTIYENILYGYPQADKEDVYKAAQRANIHDFIVSLPDGYDTYIGERGIKLSGGQKQRVSIARVFLKNPPILILDEATSSLDNATEIAIQKSLEELCKGKTTLIVAHRLSTIRNADEIIVITDEGIMERGTHISLLEKNGIYAELYMSQFSHMN